MSSRAEAIRENWFEECMSTLGESHDESVYAAIERLVAAGSEVGLSVLDLIRMLRGGMSLESLLDLIEIRIAAANPSTRSGRPNCYVGHADVNDSLRRRFNVRSLTLSNG